MVDSPRWVVGSIDSYGAIEAKALSSNDHPFHSVETSRGLKWRWGIAEQMFVAPRGNSELTEEENFLVYDWLVKNNYANGLT